MAPLVACLGESRSQSGAISEAIEARRGARRTLRNSKPLRFEPEFDSYSTSATSDILDQAFFSSFPFILILRNDPIRLFTGHTTSTVGAPSYHAVTQSLDQHHLRRWIKLVSRSEGHTVPYSDYYHVRPEVFFCPTPAACAPQPCLTKEYQSLPFQPQSTSNCRPKSNS